MAYYRVLMLHGTVIIDTTMVATCIERTLATFILDYEKKLYTMAGCGLVVEAHVFAVLSGFGYWSWGLSHAGQSSIMVSLNLLALVYTLVLRHHNKQINNVRRVVGGHLSRRYQLSENVRVLEFLIPWLLLSCVVVGCLTFGIAYAQYTSLQEISVTTYFMLLNVYVTVSYVLGARSWIWTFICKQGRKVAAVRVNADTPESHFNTLRNMWN
ncbi:hypothetical protein AAVH_19785 [Aphelenchoides avenae]|nr:hypothetical protein AAVH_19785 [Aphelenchus avenae]